MGLKNLLADAMMKVQSNIALGFIAFSSSDHELKDAVYLSNVIVTIAGSQWIEAGAI